jgi:hypothetical protein
VARRSYVTRLVTDGQAASREEEQADTAEVTMIRSWSAHVRIAVKRDSGKGGR